MWSPRTTHALNLEKFKEKFEFLFEIQTTREILGINWFKKAGKGEAGIIMAVSGHFAVKRMELDV